MFNLQEIIKGLPKSLKIVDLSAVSNTTYFYDLVVHNLDYIYNFSFSHHKYYGMVQDFRLQDISEYQEWYGQEHRAPDLQVSILLWIY